MIVRARLCLPRACLPQYHLAYDDLDWVKGISTTIVKKLHPKHRGSASAGGSAEGASQGDSKDE